MIGRVVLMCLVCKFSNIYIYIATIVLKLDSECSVNYVNVSTNCLRYTLFMSSYMRSFSCL